MPELKDLAGCVAVITGGASGIGRGIAEELLSRGVKVVIADIEQAKLDATAAEIGAVGIWTDVTQIESVQALADETLKRFGAVDIVCNNAGVGPFARIEDMSIDDWKFVINVNLWGVINGTQVFLPHLIANPRGGHFVNTGSQASLAAFPHVGAYTVTKFGVAALTETLAQELARDHPTVGASILCPGTVQSDIQNSQRNRPATLPVGGLHDVNLKEMTAEYKGTERWLEPRDVGKIVAEAILDRRLYIITHPEMYSSVAARHKAIAAAYQD